MDSKEELSSLFPSCASFVQAERKQVLLEFAEAQPKLALESNVFDHITSPDYGLKGGTILLISNAKLPHPTTLMFRK